MSSCNPLVHWGTSAEVLPRPACRTPASAGPSCRGPQTWPWPQTDGGKSLRK